MGCQLSRKQPESHDYSDTESEDPYLTRQDLVEIKGLLQELVNAQDAKRKRKQQRRGFIRKTEDQEDRSF